MDKDTEAWEALARLANILQVANFVMNVTEASNTDILMELQKQDGDFLEKIIQNTKVLLENQKRIEEKLDKIMEKLDA